MRKGEIDNVGKDHQGQAASAQLKAKITTSVCSSRAVK